METVVSVICPAYRCEPYIGAAIASVRAQTFGGWELIVADDGSSDGTVAAARAAAGADERIRVLELEHKGLPGAVRNRAAAEAKGRYLAFLDGDDLWGPEKLEVQLAFFGRNPDCEAAYHDFTFLGSDEAVARHGALWEKRLDSELGFESLLIKNCINTCTVMLRTEVFRELGGFDEDPALRVGEDHEFWLRLAARRPILRSPGNATVLRLVEHSATRGQSEYRWDAQSLRVLEKMERLGLVRDSGLIRRKRAEIQFSRGIDALYFREGSGFRRDLLEAALRYPWAPKLLAAGLSAWMPRAWLRAWLKWLLEIKNRLATAGGNEGGFNAVF
jgi:glycosyltransferase involved in cell wall biosynthesis